MSTTHRSDGVSGMTRTVCAVACAAVLIAVLASSNRAAAQAARAFASPEDAVSTLIETVRGGDVETLVAIFGADGKELIDSSDPPTARRNQQVFVVATRERWRLEDEGATRKTLVIGNEEWPFPVPLVKDADGWRFDTAAGKEEVLARRIGRNELSTIATCRAYVTAQQRYAQQGHDGRPPGRYATKFLSDAGKENGLYWPAARGQKRSPLGDLVAQAAEEGRPIGTDRTGPSPLHGYYFRILTAQGAAAPGGAKPYVADGEMSGGFALVAWPAQYDVTGVMTFVVNHDGVVYEKDLGASTDALARNLTAYDPDSSWQEAP